ncbi:hypothetical protein FB45DRAFT_1019467 [Roridomyces roridus]|uniref:Velvet domain-containing protein n=1 Tax=Roridomyces roridus TaxID=1738132 RepID=A0AAD7CFH0_9AGAR|nr:hypothetical protein FB45DRAFT_1019467 [Roridomyces roridus]
MTHIVEIQSPIHGRKSHKRGQGALRPLDPPPLVELNCLDEQLHNRFLFYCSSEKTVYCTAELFRVPSPTPCASPTGEWTYYTPLGVDLDTGLPTYQLSTGSGPIPRDNVGQFGNHILHAGASESHLLRGNQTAQAHVNPQTGRITFAFPGLGVLQNGHYLLGYRVSVGTESNAPIVATCLGGVFSVERADNFQGMQAKTALTQALKPVNVLRR